MEELEFLPPAIVQAASYIISRAPRCSVSEYLRDFQRSDREATTLLKNEAGHFHRDWEPIAIEEFFYPLIHPFWIPYVHPVSKIGLQILDYSLKKEHTISANSALPESL
jgi:hypothetical protein